VSISRGLTGRTVLLRLRSLGPDELGPYVAPLLDALPALIKAACASLARPLSPPRFF
jgi:hypothetical protein